MKLKVTEHPDADLNAAALMLHALREQWEWNSMPVLMPMVQHKDHYHPIGMFGFSEMERVEDVIEVFCDPEESPLVRMGPPPGRITGVALVWEQFIRPGGPGNPNVQPGDDPDDLEVRLCVTYVDSEFTQAVHLRAEDQIGEPVWGTNEPGWDPSPLTDEQQNALRSFVEYLSTIEPAPDKDEE